MVSRELAFLSHRCTLINKFIIIALSSLTVHNRSFCAKMTIWANDDTIIISYTLRKKGAKRVLSLSCRGNPQRFSIRNGTILEGSIARVLPTGHFRTLLASFFLRVYSKCTYIYNVNLLIVKCL